MQQFLLLFAARFVTAGTVAVLGSMVASLYYVDLAGVDDPYEVMETRPDVPGSRYALWETHKDHCWTDDHPKGPVTGAILREHPNDPYVYATDPVSVGRALDKDPTLDDLLAYCTDR